MTDVKTWRLLTDGDGGATEPLRAEEIAARLWAGDSELSWAEPLQSGEADFPEDLPEVRRLLLADPNRVARAVLRQPGADELEWIFVWAVETLGEHPAEAWPLLVALIEESRRDDDLRIIGAYPLGNVLVRHGDGVIGRIEEWAGRDARVRQALAAVGPTDVPEAVWQRVLEASAVEGRSGA